MKLLALCVAVAHHDPFVGFSSHKCRLSAPPQQPIPFFNAPIELETDHVDLPPVEPRDAKADRELALKRAKVRKIRLKRAMKRSGYRALLDAPVHIRNACRALVNWIWFDRFVLALILGNCVLLAMDVPGAQLSTSQQNVRPRARGLLLLLLPLPLLVQVLEPPLRRHPQKQQQPACPRPRHHQRRKHPTAQR